MHAVSTSEIADVLHFNDRYMKTDRRETKKPPLFVSLNIILKCFPINCNNCIRIWESINKEDHYYAPGTGRTLNVHKTFRRRPGHLLNVLCMFSVPLVPRRYEAGRQRNIRKPCFKRYHYASIHRSSKWSKLVWNALKGNVLSTV